MTKSSAFFYSIWGGGRSLSIGSLSRGICPAGSLSRGSLSRGIFVRRSLFGGSLSRGSLSEGLSKGGGGSLSRGISV